VQVWVNNVDSVGWKSRCLQNMCFTEGSRMHLGTNWDSLEMWERWIMRFLTSLTFRCF